MWNTYELLLEYGIHTLDRNGLGSLVVRHPSTGGETRFDSWSGQNLSYISLSPPHSSFTCKLNGQSDPHIEVRQLLD